MGLMLMLAMGLGLGMELVNLVVLVQVVVEGPASVRLEVITPTININ